MPKAIVCNHDNNFGDCLAQMGVLKEWKELNPEWTLDFISCYWPHYEAAKHTDLFNKVTFLRDLPYVVSVLSDYKTHGYDRTIDFKIDFTRALQIGLKKAWAERTLGFISKDDKPYFLISKDEQDHAQIEWEKIHALGFRKHIIIQLNAPSNPKRSIAPEDWNIILDMIPKDVLVIYPCVMQAGMTHTFEKNRENLLTLPGYPFGETAYLMQQVDLNLIVHGGFAHLAYAVDAPHILHLHFEEEGGRNLLEIPHGTNLHFLTNKTIDYTLLKQSLDTFL